MAKRYGTADSMAKKAQLARGKAAMKKGAEGPKGSMPSGQELYFIPEGGGEYSRVMVPAGKKPPKGAIKASKKGRPTGPGGYSKARTRKKSMLELKMQSKNAKDKLKRRKQGM